MTAPTSAPRVAIGFSTKDKPASAGRVLECLAPDRDAPLYDLFWFDGSTTLAGNYLLGDAPSHVKTFTNVTGGPDRAFVFAVTTMLAATDYVDPATNNGWSTKPRYTHIGYCEDDVLLEPGWFNPTFALFARARDEGLEAGAVSARAYEDRVLIQRDGYAVMHNLGWGHAIFTREAAELVLKHYRTGWTTENRRVFACLTGKDIAAWWAFRGQEQWICSDWGADAVLAQHGLASLALTPSPCEMIGQDPPLDQQGLKLVKRNVDILRDDRVFAHYVAALHRIRAGHLQMAPRPLVFELDVGGFIYFAHQFTMLDGFHWRGEWECEWNLGFGPFAWRAAELKPPVVNSPEFVFNAAGPIDVMIGGGKTGGSCRIRDMASGYEITPELKAAGIGDQMFVNAVVPANVSWRQVVVDRIDPGLVVYGLKTKERQPVDPHWRFDASSLPPFEQLPLSIETS